MAVVDAASVPAPSARFLALPARAVLGAIVGVSFAARWALGSLHGTPIYFPDEYIYPALARSIAETGRPLVRGELAPFPALLEPILAAPFWLAGDVELAYRLTQGLHALAFSLAAVPAYLLARRLGLGTRLSLALAALAVAWPGASYASFMLGDPIAYPLVLATIYAGVVVLERPTARGQALVLGLAGLAALARTQYAVLPIAFLAAVLVVERWRPGSVFRRYRATLVLLALPLLGSLALGPRRAVGYYGVVFDLELDPVGLATWASRDLMVLAYAAGWVIVPGALIGLAQALWRPRDRAERAFGALAIAFSALTLLEAALYESNAAPHLARVHERYLIAVMPLVALGFGLYVRNGLPRRRAVGLVAAGLLLLSVRVPLSEFVVAQGPSDSPTLKAVRHLGWLVGVADGAFAVAIAAAVLSLAAVALAFGLRSGTPLALGLTLAIALALNAGSYAFDGRTSRAHDERWHAEKRWVEEAGAGPTVLLQLPFADRARTYEQLFWNPSIERLLVLGGPVIDKFPHEAVRVRRDGLLLVDGKPLRGPVVVHTWGAYAELEGVTRVARHREGFELVRSADGVRVRMIVRGLFGDGWLNESGTIVVWPRRGERLDGTLRLELSMPPDTAAIPLRLSAPGFDRTIEVPNGGSAVVEVPVRSGEAWQLDFSTPAAGWIGRERRVSVRAKPPTFLEAGAAIPRTGAA